MNKFMISAASLAGLSGAFAAPAAAADLGNGFSASGGATLVSDYRFRGISQTDKRAAVQGTFTLSHKSGLYATVWGSSIADYVENGSNQEIDLIAGYSKTFGNTKIDGGVLYYYYPGSGGINSDFFEPYVNVSQTFGPVTAKVTANYGFKQKGLALNQVSPKQDNLYLAGDLSAAIPKTPVSLTAHFGHTYGPSYLSIGKGYSDWGVGASVAVKNLTFGVQYVDTSKHNQFVIGTRDEAKAGIVGSVGVSF
jgi:uncharacterized protein (TIGR02001 family)